MKNPKVRSRRYEIGKTLIVFSYFLLLTSRIYASSGFELTSPAFQEGEMIPEVYTCDGKNSSPPLNWTAPPQETRSFVLVVEDPDAPGGLWTHWILFNLPPTIMNIPEGLPAIRNLANMERHGNNDFKQLGYGGPCPPPGATHRYVFKFYALDNAPNLEIGATRAEILAAVEGHVLASAELTGRYERRRATF